MHARQAIASPELFLTRSFFFFITTAAETYRESFLCREYTKYRSWCPDTLAQISSVSVICMPKETTLNCSVNKKYLQLFHFTLLMHALFHEIICRLHEAKREKMWVDLVDEERETEIVTKPENALLHYAVVCCIFPPIFMRLSIAAYTLSSCSATAHSSVSARNRARVYLCISLNLMQELPYETTRK